MWLKLGSSAMCCCLIGKWVTMLRIASVDAMYAVAYIQCQILS